MLSLKSMSVAAFSHEPKTSIRQLPVEILDDIAQHVFDDGLRQIDILIPFASTCRRFRESALPILFRRVSFAVQEDDDDCAGGNLRRLLAHPHLLTKVQALHVTVPFDRPGTVPQALGHTTSPSVARPHASDLETLREALLSMPLLRRVRFECHADAAYQILLMLPTDRTYEIILDRIYATQTWPDPRSVVAKLPLVVSCHKLSVGMFGDSSTQDDVATASFHQALLRASAAHVPADWLLGDGMENAMQTTRTPLSFGKDDSLEELLIETRRWPGYIPTTLYTTQTEFPWERLRRLSLDLGGFLSEFWRHTGPRLSMLEALRIHGPIGPTYSPGYGDARHQTRRLANFNGEQVDGQSQDSFDLTDLHSLRELEINGKNFLVPMGKLVGPGLRRLRLHSENAQLYAFQSRHQRSPAEIIEAARRAPELEHLELDIGYIDNLWHPTAIPGVDVDVEQYSFLDAITRFRRLRFLRLFPPFVARGETFDYDRARLCVPVSDDQAIRVFEHVRKKCPRLQMLSIAAVPYAVRTDTMSWEVKRHGGRTILTTRHRERNYQHRQVWVGQRRLSSEIQRFTKRTPYLPESESWTLSDVSWEDPI